VDAPIYRLIHIGLDRQHAGSSNKHEIQVIDNRLIRVVQYGKTKSHCWEVKEEGPEYAHEVASTSWDSGPGLL